MRLKRLDSSHTLERTWAEVQEGLNNVFFHHGMGHKRYIELYTHVYNYCTAVNTPAMMKPPIDGRKDFVGYELYQLVRDYLENFVKNQNIKARKHVDLLDFYAIAWENYSLSTKVLNGMCAYMNRFFKKQAHEAESSFYDIRTDNVFVVTDLALKIWNDHFFCNVSKRLTVMLIDQIQEERKGNQINSSLVKSVINSYITLGSAVSVGEPKPSPEQMLRIYENEFVRHYIEETVRFYKVESGRFLDSNPGINGLKEFLKKAELRLDEEQVRSDRYLHYSSTKKAMKECEKAIIGDRKDVFVQTFVPLLEHSQTADLARMYRLAKRVDQGLTPIRSKFEDFIVTSGLTSMESVGLTPEPKVFVGKILHIYERFSRINQICFDNEFKESLDRAATKFINKNKACEEKTTLCPELVAKYCDSLLKRSNKTIDEPGTEEKFNQIMIVFKYIEDKDVFETHYSRMFANRLIKGTSGSDDAEESILQKLNDICGFEYTAKLNRMWQDINTSKGTTEKFKKALQEEGIELGIDFSVKLLSTGSWPLTKAFSMELPGVLSNSLRVFKEHYDKKNPRRTLTWLCSQSKGEITANYQSKNYVLVASTIQMAVLLLFNNENQLTVAEISRRLAVDSTLMQQVVLVLLKHQLLCLGPYPSLPETEGCDKLPGKEDLLSYNKDFFNKRTKITINVTYKIESHAEDPVTTKNIEADRKLLIQAAIVRIMKTRKQVNHSTLMSETINHLASRFKPSVQKIKACVETLIEKEYIERVDGKDVYIYVA